MHQIRLRLGLHTDAAGSLTHHHKPLALRDPTSKGRKDGREGQRNWRGEGRVGEEDFWAFHQFHICHYTSGHDWTISPLDAG